MALITDGDYVFAAHIDNLREAAKGRGVVSGLAVSEQGTPDKTIDVATGVAQFGTTTVTKAAITNVDLTSHIDATNPKKVIITMNSSGTIAVTAGTAAAATPVGNTDSQTKTPTCPNLPADLIMLAEVWLAAAETTVLDADISDRRCYTQNWASLNEKELHVPLLYAGGTPASYAEAHAQLTGNALDAVNEHMRGSFKVPNGFTTLTGATLSFVARTNGNFDYTFTTSWGAVGESFIADTDSITEDGKVIVDNVVNEIDISAAFTGIVANDLVNVKFNLDALDTTTSVIVGFISLWYA